MLALCILFILLLLGGSGALISADHSRVANASLAALPPASLLPVLQNAPSQIFYDEQLGITFTQSFNSLEYNVTAVEQQEPSSGLGPAYLLNGLSNTGYWYQVGLSYDWGGNASEQGYAAGFDMNYEVFNTIKDSVFPTNGGGGIMTYSGPVNPGDTVLLSLYFSGGDVVMFSKDLNTGAAGSVSYSAEGASTFVGLSAPSNSNGYFTGLMTEWYHSAPYYGDPAEVLYSNTAVPLTSAMMWIDEFPTNGLVSGQTLFSRSSSLLSYSSNPTQLQELSYEGATEYSDAYEYITGAMATSQVSLTLSYSIEGGGTGYSAPVLTYVSGGVTETTTLGTSATTFDVDPGSTWSVSPVLTGSTSSERWETGQMASGTATSSQTITFVYYNQYLQVLSYSVSDSSTPPPPSFTADQFGSPVSQVLSSSPVGYWFDNGASWLVTNPIPGGTGERWLINSTLQAASGTVSSAQTMHFVYDHQFQVTFTVSPPGDGTTIPAGSGVWEDAGSLPITATANAGYTFSGWSASTASITFASATTASTTASIDASGTITANFGAAGSVTFSASSIGNVAGSTDVLTVSTGGSGASCTGGAATTVTESELPYTTASLPSGTDVCYSFDSPLSSSVTGQQYRWGSTTGTGSASGQTGESGSFSASSTSTVTGTYITQWEVSFAATPGGAGATSPSGSAFYDAGQLSISATPNTNYAFSTWTSSTGSITFVSPTSASTSATISGTGTITANFDIKESITVTVANSAPSATVTVNGCDASPSTFPADGSEHSVTLEPSCSFALSFSNSGATRDGFDVSSAFSDTSGTYTSSATSLSLTAYEQLQNTFSVTISGGNPGVADTIVLTGTYLGTGGSTVLLLSVGGVNSATNSAWSDYGTAVTFPATSADSTSIERWAINGATGTGSLTSGGGTYSETYYHQFAVVCSYSVTYGGSPSAPTMTATQFGSSYLPTLGTSGTAYWLDSLTTYSVPSTIAGGTGEEWAVQINSHTASASTTTVFAYYHWYSQTLSYSVSGGGSPTAPTATGTEYGSAYNPTLTGTPTSYWFDADGRVAFTDPLGGSGSTERWDSSVSSVSATSPAATVLTYYNQFQASFSYSVVNGVAPAPPVLSCDQEGSPAILTLSTSPQPFWCDGGSTAVAAIATASSPPTERWSDNGESFSISGAGIIDTFTYYEQFLVTLSYSVSGGGSPNPPPLNGTSFGVAVSTVLSASPSTFWLDSGSFVSLPASLLPSSASERWVTNATLPIEVSSAVMETVNYQHQFYVSVETAKTGGGSVSPASGWFDVTSAPRITSTSDPGWELGTWIGSGPGAYSGNATSTTVQIRGPINETAVFYPCLNLSVETGGSVTYTYGSTLGQASPGQLVLYVPPDTNVTLVASPASIFYSFSGWKIAQTSSSSSVEVFMSAPSTIEAAFSYNPVTIVGLVGVAVAIVVAVAVFYGMRRTKPTL